AVTVTVEAEATHLPSSLEVSIEGREIGQHVHAGDVELPKNVALVTEADAIVVNISEAVVVAEEPAEGEAAEAAEAPAEEAGE
ncbi:MAG: 50S ribosomal protein L25, partial [Sinomonas sp.]|nr:50S ribosomal protein L25 [Sinomonas sp.]